MLKLNKVHHIAIICSNYKKSKAFYTQILGFKIEQEIYRKERSSFKLDLSLNGSYTLELFSFPDSPVRPSRPEAVGLRHIAFEVNNLDESIEFLKRQNISVEPIRLDEFTNKRFAIFTDPDMLPIELYEK